MANITISTAAVDIDQVWSPELNRAIQLDIVLAALFDDKSALVDQHGNTINLPSRHNLTANAKAAGVAAVPQAITETNQQFVLPMTNGHRIIAQEIEDIAEIQSRYDIRNETTVAGSYALARQMDVDAGSLFSTNATLTVGTLGAELMDDNLLTARTNLRNNAAPRPWYFAVSPAAYSGLLKLDKFVNKMYGAADDGSAVTEAKIGAVYNAEGYETQLLTGTAPNASGAWWSKSHYFKAVQRQPTTHTWYSPLDVAWVITMDTIYGMFERLEADEGAGATTNSINWAVRLQTLK